MARQPSSTAKDRVAGLFKGYRPEPGTYDEAFDERGRPRRAIVRVIRLLDALGRAELRQRMRLADAALRRHGVTFGVYSDPKGVERIFPFDLIPRLVVRRDWVRVERGLQQRIAALNAFLSDIYADAKILSDGRITSEIVRGSKG